MKAIIMAGGKGTRLRPITCELPKPMVPVMNIPLMEHIIILLKNHGITEIGVTLMYLPQKIKGYFKDGSPWGVHLTYFMEESPLGTAGSILRAASFLDDTFVVISGDCMTDVNLSEVIRFHCLKKAIATLVLTRVDYPLDFGIVATDSSGYITGFLEKPNRNEIFSDTINTGIYVMEPDVLNYIKPEQPFDFSRDLFPKLVDGGLPLIGYTSCNYWSDVGSLEAYLNTHKDIFDLKPCIFTNKKNNPESISIGQSTVIEPTAIINGPCIIGGNCYIGHGTVIDSYTVIGHNCIIEDHSSIKRSILFNNCSIGPGCELRGSILGTKVRLMRYVSSYENAAIGDESIIHERSIIKPNIHIWPGKTVDSLSIVDRNIVWASRYNSSLFNSNSLSGTINVDITPEFASRLGSAYGSVLGQGKSLVVSSDNSNASNLFKYAFISGLMSVGTRVYNLDGVPIPLARQAVHMLQVVGGIHIRRSSESPEKLEMNLFDETGANADNLLGKTIEDVFFKEDFLRCRAEYIMDINNISDFHQYYISYLQNRVNMEYVKIHPPTVFVISDCEAMLSFVRTIFTHVNIPICGEMYVDKFEPKKIRSVEHFIHADLTAFIDRNGEKLVLLDSGGKVLDETRLFLLHAYLLFKTIPGYNIFAPLNMTAALEHMAEDFGGSVKRTKTSGNAVLRELMKADVFADNLNQYMLQFDAVASLVKTVEYLSSQNTTLDNLLKFIPRHFIKHALILCPLEAIGRVMRILHQESGCKKQLFDGIRIILEQGWVLIMPDAEKPFIHLYVEGNSSKEANMLLSNYSARIKKLTAGDVNI